MSSRLGLAQDVGCGPRLALALGGGGARGFAHLGVLEVLEREGIEPAFIAGSSMGALLGALRARGLGVSEILDVVRDFRAPRLVLPGTLLRFEAIFRSALPDLGIDFKDLGLPFAVTAVDLETGAGVVLHDGALQPAVQASCALPGLFRPVEVGGRLLVDGGLLNVLPVDVAWLGEPDVVVAVRVSARSPGSISTLKERWQRRASAAHGRLPSPGLAKLAFDTLMRAWDISIDHQIAAATAMTNPEVLIEPEVGDVGLRDFHRLEESRDAGRRAAEAALPAVVEALGRSPGRDRLGERSLTLRFDPVCGMAISPGRSRATARVGRATVYFCSSRCRENFQADPPRFLGRAGLTD